MKNVDFCIIQTSGFLTLSSKNDSESNIQMGFRAMNCKLGGKYI